MEKKNLEKNIALLMLAVILVCTAILSFVYIREIRADSICESVEQGSADLTEYNKFWLNGHGKKNETPLMTACRIGDGESIIRFLELGANPNKTVGKRMTALELFCKYGYSAGDAAMEKMLQYGASQTDYAVIPPVFHLAESFVNMTADEKDVATKQTVLLLKYGAPLRYKDTTLLHLAAKANMAELFDIIVHTTAGIKLINTSDANGKTPWQIACENGAFDVQTVIRNLEKEASDYGEEQKQETSSTAESGENMSEPPPETSATIDFNGIIVPIE